MSATEKDVLAFLRSQDQPKPTGLRERFKSRDLPGMGFGREIDQMMTFGLADEIKAAVQAVGDKLQGKPFVESYRERKLDDQALREDYQREHPGRALTATLVGGAAAIPTAGGRAAGAVAPTLGRVMKEGAAVGAAYGAGEAEGGFTDRAFGAAVGAGTGALGGAAAHGVFRGADALSKLPTGARSTVGALIGAPAGALLNPDDMKEGAVAGAGIGAAAVNTPAAVRAALQGYAERKAARAAAPATGSRLAGVMADQSGAVPAADIARAVKSAVASLQPNADEAANVQILQRLENGGQTAAERLQALQDAVRGAQKPLALIDTDENLRGTARAVRAVHGRGKEEIPATLQQRQKGQLDRLRDDLVETTGLGQRINTRATIDEIDAARSEAVRPLYDEAFDTTPALDDEDILGRIEQLTNIVPSLRGKVEQAMKAQQARHNLPRSAFFERVNRPVPRVWNGEPIEDGVEAVEVPTLRYFDTLKKALDEWLPAARRNPADTGGVTATVDADVRALKNELLDLVDTYAGRGDPEASAYRAARREYGGRGAGIDALELGAKFRTMSADEVEREFAQMGKTEKDLARKAYIDDLLSYGEEVADRHNLTARKPFDPDVPATKRKLAILFEGGQGLEEFQKRLAQEVQMAGTTSSVLGGSNTADKLMELAGLFDVDPGALLSGNVRDIGLRLAARLGQRAREAVSGRTSEETANALTTKLLATGNERDEMLKALQDTLQRLQKRETGRSAVRRGSAAGGASAAGDYY